MPLYYYHCSKCYRTQRKIQTPEEAKKVQTCGLPFTKIDGDRKEEKNCGYTLIRDPKPPSSRVTEVLDNGLQTKRIERLADAERLFQERNAIVKKQQFGDGSDQ